MSCLKVVHNVAEASNRFHTEVLEEGSQIETTVPEQGPRTKKLGRPSPASYKENVDRLDPQIGLPIFRFVASSLSKHRVMECLSSLSQVYVF